MPGGQIRAFNNRPLSEVNKICSNRLLSGAAAFQNNFMLYQLLVFALAKDVMAQLCYGYECKLGSHITAL